MPKIRNSYGNNFVNVAGTMIAPKRAATIPDETWDAWLQHSGNQRDASMYLEVITGDLTDEQLTARDEGQALFDETGEQDATPSDRERLIDAAVEAIFIDADPATFTQAGNPRLDVVRERTGLSDATAAEVVASVTRRDEQSDGE